MSNFKYDIVTLIELIESYPCIWDKTNDAHKNKILRDKSWQEIYLFLEDGYEELSQEEKKKIGNNIMAKWTNVRDSFMRSLKAKSGQAAKKKYMYSEHLQFLLKIAQKDDTESNFTSQLGTEEDLFEDFRDSQTPSTLSQYQPKKATSRENKTRSKRQLDSIEREILSELKKGKHEDEQSSSHSRSYHEMMLLSFVPYIEDMNKTELMDFQMGALGLIKKIQNQRVSTQPELVTVPMSPPARTHSSLKSPSPSMNWLEQEQYNQHISDIVDQ